MTNGEAGIAYSFDPGSARDLRRKVGPKTGVAFFQDGEERYATFRGVNFAPRAKLAPYLPVDAPTDQGDISDADFDAQIDDLQTQFDEIRELGWNVVRLLVMWKGLEPEPSADPAVLSPAGERYLRRVLRFIEEFHRRGIFVFIDFHQDIAHEVYNGDGFPDWALAIDPDHPRPTDADFKHKNWQSEYVAAPILSKHGNEVRHTLQSFWNDDLRNDDLSPDEQARARHPRTHLAKTIGATARWLQANAGPARDAIIAYQVFNEPHQVGFDKQKFETEYLPAHYRQATAEIRRAYGGLPGDDDAFVMIQPRVDWNVANATAADMPIPLVDFTLDPVTYLDTDRLDAEKTVFTYHHYDPWTSTYHAAPIPRGDDMAKKLTDWPPLYDKMRAPAVERGLIPFMTEFGANHAWDGHGTSLRPDLYRNQQTRAYIDIQMQQADRQVLNWTYWNYNPFNTEDDADGWNVEDFSLLGPGRTPRNHELVCRPYPMRSSAEPVRVFFDAGTQFCVMQFAGKPVDAPTVIYVPRELHYKGEFDAWLSSKRVEWDDEKDLLYWWPDPAQTEHVLVLTRGPLGVWPFPGKIAQLLFRLLLGAVHHVRLPEGTLVEKLGIQGVVADPPGSDVKNEHVLVSNPTETAVDLDGWRLRDRAGHLFTFPAYTLAAGSVVRVWTGSHQNGADELSMGRGRAIWNNSGDEAVLLDAAGSEVSRLAY